jgi:hypothetical protein
MLHSLVRRRWARSGVAAVLLALNSPGVLATAEDDAIRTVALDYAEGWLTGDEQRMARALHPEALKRRVVTDVLDDTQRVQVLDAATLIKATAEGVGVGIGGTDGALSLRVAILDRHGDMAVVRVVSPLYVDYLQMVRWEGEWVILMVLWGTLAAPGD